jgi:YidC/Oxa1 family membrane protein insertase
VGALWTQFKEVIFDFLVVIEGTVGDWGMAIIVLTILVRLLLMPLTIKQTKSMYELQRIQPKIKELQKKYADDKEKLQEETLKFYQDNKVNPFGGCLPLLLQMPLLIALYQVLGRHRGSGLADSLPWRSSTLSAASTSSFRTSLWLRRRVREQGLLAAIPYVILVVLFASERLAAPGSHARRAPAEDDRRLHGDRHAVLRVERARGSTALLGPFQHLGCGAAADHYGDDEASHPEAAAGGPEWPPSKRRSRRRQRQEGL